MYAERSTSLLSILIAIMLIVILASIPLFLLLARFTVEAGRLAAQEGVAGLVKVEGVSVENSTLVVFVRNIGTRRVVVNKLFIEKGGTVVCPLDVASGPIEIDPGYVAKVSAFIPSSLAQGKYVVRVGTVHGKSGSFQHFFYVPSRRGSAWLEGWAYRREIAVAENSGADLYEYQVRIVLLPGFDYSKMRSDGGDLRFTDSDGLSLLPYWVETWRPNDSSIVWVRVPKIPGSSVKRIFMYYGNPHAESESNGEVVFELFEDFEGGIPDWVLNDWGTRWGGIEWDEGRMLLWVYRCHNVEAYRDLGTYSGVGLAVKFEWETRADSSHEEPGWDVLVNGRAVKATLLHGSEMIVETSGSKKGSLEATVRTGGSVRLVFRLYQSRTCNLEDHAYTYFWVDNMRVRKYVNPEPSVTIGPEESP